MRQVPGLMRSEYQGVTVVQRHRTWQGLGCRCWDHTPLGLLEQLLLDLACRGGTEDLGHVSERT